MASLARLGILLSVGILAAACVDAGIRDPQGVRPDAHLSPLQVLPPDANEMSSKALWDGLPLNTTCHGHCVWEVVLPVEGDAWVVWNGSQSRGFTVAWQPAPTGAWDTAMGTAAPTSVFLTGRTEGWLPAARGFDLAKVHAKGPGALHAWGDGDIRLEMTGENAGLPNLVAMVPAHIGFSAKGDPHRPGCQEMELGLRCLRFSTGLANLGDVPLDLEAGQIPVGDVTVPILQGLPGGPIPSGTAQYHATHGHFHYNGLAAFSLHPVVDGLRQPAAVTQGKTGFCTVDWGVVRDGGVVPEKAFWRDDCRLGRELRMGISPNWYDLYRWFLPEQSLDVATLPPGTYDLVVDLDPGRTLDESTRLDNQAALRIDWDGMTATAGEGFGFLQLP